jgi:dipeptide/tripeptide permease
MQMHSACQETINEDLTVEAISAAIYHSHAVRGRNFSSFDLPKKRRRRLRFVVMLFLVITIGWLICESATALAILGS